jgi:glucose/arabinose dehydrogenase
VRVAAVAALVLLLAGCARSPDPLPPGTIEGGLALAPVLDGLASPVFFLEEPALGSFFVAEQGGTVIRVQGGERSTFLDLSAQVSRGGEQGLLGLAFHPRLADGDARFYVHFTDAGGDTRVHEYAVVQGLAVFRRELLAEAQPYSNHNGGMLAFGPDGMLYLALGDGGGGGDPDDRAQDLESRLGKILRLDVDGDSLAPADNPFVGTAGRDEVWHYGLRNPWRFSFDRANGDLWIGDVGQGAWEEVDVARAGQKGLNFGWDAFEGTHRHEAGDAPGHVLPVAEYDHSNNRQAVTGGYVYRGQAIPSLQGTYLFADYASGEVWGLDAATGTGMRPLLTTGFPVSSFGEDAAGELYLVGLGGTVHKLAPG